MGFSRQEYWSELPCPPPRGSSRPRDGTCVSYVLTLAGGFFTTRATWEAQVTHVCYHTEITYLIFDALQNINSVENWLMAAKVAHRWKTALDRWKTSLGDAQRHNKEHLLMGEPQTRTRSQTIWLWPYLWYLLISWPYNCFFINCKR